VNAIRNLPRKYRVAGVVTLGGLVLLLVCGLIVRDGTVGPVERDVFHAINGLPGWLYQPLWIFQQLGNLVVAFLATVLVAVILRRPALGVAAVVAVVAKLQLEDVVKSIVERSRPGTSVGDAILRGQVSFSGLSFVSGHAVIAVACATALSAVLSRRWRYVVWVLVALNGFTRIYVGAHNPLDVVGGAGLGLAIGGPLYAWLADSDSESTPAPAERQEVS
jgi:undecaprenyl-diphosphatase